MNRPRAVLINAKLRASHAYFSLNLLNIDYAVGPVQLTVVLLTLAEVEIEVMEIAPTQAIVVPRLVGGKF